MFAADAGFCNAHLGAEVLRCRLLGQKELSKRVGFSAFDFYAQIVIALTVAPFMGTVVLVGIPVAIHNAFAEPIPPASSGNPVLLAIVILVYLLLVGAIVWYAFFLPRKNCLVFHERGLRYRQGLKEGAVLFEDLRELRIGRNWTPFEASAMRVNRWTHPGLHQMAENARHLSLTLSMTSGERVVLKGILLQYAQGDVDALLARLGRQFANALRIDP